MTSTTSAERFRAGMLPMALLGLTAVLCQAAPATDRSPEMTQAQTLSRTFPARQQAVVPIAASAAAGVSQKPKESRMWMTVNERRFAITLFDNDAARAFAAQLPLTLHMEELNGNEKHAKLPTALPAHASRPGAIRAGDLMLYGADTLVVFYSTFNSVYSYTRVGRVDDTAGLAQALGPQGVQITFSGQ